MSDYTATQPVYVVPIGSPGAQPVVIVSAGQPATRWVRVVEAGTAGAQPVYVVPAGTAGAEPVLVRSGTLLAYTQQVLALSPLRYWPFDDASGTTARELVVGNTASYRNSVAAGSSWPTASGLSTFVAPALFPSSGDILLNSTPWAASFSFNEGAIQFWTRASVAGWDDVTLRRPLILQGATTSNRITGVKNAGTDTLVCSYLGGGTSKDITIPNLSQYGSGWLHIVLVWSKSGDYFCVYVNAQLVGTTTGLPTITGPLSTIAQFGGNPFSPNFTYAHAAIWARALTQDDVDALYYGVIRDRLIVFEGDSLTVGGQNGAMPYPKQLMRATTNETVARVVAASGEKVSDMVVQFASTVAPLFKPATYRKDTAVLFGGANDVTNETAPVAYDRLKTWWALARATGYKVVACTLPAGAPAAAGGGYNTRRNSLNTLIKSDTSLYDALADLAANTNIGDDGDQDNTTYFNTDKLHLTTAGYGVVATIVAAAVAIV